MDRIRTQSSFISGDDDLSREMTIFVCYQFFMKLRNRYAINPYSQMMALDGTMMMLASSGGYG